MKLSVLLTCYNRKAKTIACLEALYACSKPSNCILSVFLVDDGSTDGTSEAVKGKFEAVNIIEGTGSLFWNGGMHFAWGQATLQHESDYYLWLNDDTVLLPSAIDELLICAANSAKPNIICGAIRSAETNEFTYGGVTKDGKAVKPNGKIQPCYIINGNCVLVSKSAFELVGNLDRIFPHAIGDHDYGLRLLKAGGEIYTTRKFIATCERNETLPKWCYSSTPIKERVRALYSPLGNSHPKYYFIYEKRHFGLLTAVKHYLSIHLRVLIPSLWKL